MKDNGYKYYDDEIAVPFFPRRWLKAFTCVYGGIIAFYFLNKHIFKWGYLDNQSTHLSDGWLGEISILTTVIFSGTFALGRLIYWRSDKDRKRGRDDILGQVAKVLDNSDQAWTDQQKLQEIQKVVNQHR